MCAVNPTFSGNQVNLESCLLQQIYSVVYTLALIRLGIICVLYVYTMNVYVVMCPCYCMVG